MKSLLSTPAAYVFIAFFALLSVPVHADESVKPETSQAMPSGMPSPEQMQKMMEVGSPSEHHSILKKLEGTWDYTMSYRMMPDAPEQTSKGVSTNTLLFEGRYLQQEVAGPFDMGGQTHNYEGIGVLGYDNVHKKYQSYWIDNMNTTMMLASGSYDEASQTLTEEGRHYCPMQGKDVDFKSTLKFLDEKNAAYTMYQKGENGEHWKMMEIQYVLR